MGGVWSNDEESDDTWYGSGGGAVDAPHQPHQRILSNDTLGQHHGTRSSSEDHSRGATGESAVLAPYTHVPTEDAERHYRESSVPPLLAEADGPRGNQITPTANRDTKVLKNPANLNYKSVSIHRDDTAHNIWHLEFTYDSTCAASLEIHYVARETHDTSNHLRIMAERTTRPIILEPGMGKKFRTSSSDALNVLDHSVTDMTYKAVSQDCDAGDPPTQYYPVILQLFVPNSSPAQSQLTYVSLRRGSTVAEGENREGNMGWNVDVLGQKIQVGTNIYIVHEIYGIDSGKGSGDGAANDEGLECVICLTEPRTTAVLPCRHMCLCNACAEWMRVWSNKCPVCRQAATGLLKINIDGS